MSQTYILSKQQANRLQEILEERGYQARTVPYARYSYVKPGVSITVYEKQNKLLVQGSDSREFIEFTLEPEVLGTDLWANVSDGVVQDGEYMPHFGIDESGKGDYFGPLVIAGVYVDAESAVLLRQLGVCDSKLIKQAGKIKTMAASIKKTKGVVWNVVAIGPERYNEIYAKMNNLNHLLAWGHARVIENLMQEVPDCPRALSDQFAKPYVLQRALKQKNIDIQLEQRTKAESDVAVAAASILARDKFVSWLEEAAKAGGVELPLGASSRVNAAARKVVAQYGREMLGKVAKLHFKTTKDVLGSFSGE